MARAISIDLRPRICAGDVGTHHDEGPKALRKLWRRSQLRAVDADVASIAAQQEDKRRKTAMPPA